MKDNKKLKGSGIDLYEMNMVLYGTGDPDTPNISPSTMKEIWDCAKPKIDIPIGRVIITGTPIGNKDFKETWDNAKTKK